MNESKRVELYYGHLSSREIPAFLFERRTNEGGEKPGCQRLINAILSLAFFLRHVYTRDLVAG